jgi:branched-chain amino acid transport system permease protein
MRGAYRWIAGHPSTSIIVFFAILPFIVPYKALATQLLVYGLFALGFNLLYGYTGLLSFGHAAYFGLGAYGAGITLAKLGWHSVWGALLIGVAAAGIGGALVGFFSLRRRGIYFAMLTLAFAQIAYAIVHQWYDVTGGDNGLLGVWPARWLAAALHYYYVALALTGVGIGLLAIVGRSPFGLTLRAARDHARRAEAVGVNVRLHQWAAFVIAGFFAGLAGATFAFLKGSVFPNYLEVPMSVEPLVMVLLGGIQTLAGAPVGAAVYKVLDTIVTRYTEYWQLVLGALLIVLVVAFPRGILGAAGERRGVIGMPRGVIGNDP